MSSLSVPKVMLFFGVLLIFFIGGGIFYLDSQNRPPAQIEVRQQLALPGAESSFAGKGAAANLPEIPQPKPLPAPLQNP